LLFQQKYGVAYRKNQQGEMIKIKDFVNLV